MARRKYTETDRERVYMEYARTGSLSECARRTGVAKSTVREWVHARPNDALDAAREKAQIEAIAEAEEMVKSRDKEFVDQTSRIIDMGLELMERRIRRALDKERELDALLDELDAALDDENIDKNAAYKRRQRILGVLEDIEIKDIRALTTAIGTMYDKRALAKGETTQNTAVTVKLPEDVKMYAE